MLDRTRRVGAQCAIAGAMLLLLGTFLHPISADPNDALATFTEFAADRLWVLSHLIDLAGLALTMAALHFLARQLEARGVPGWPRLAASGAIASLAVAAVLVAVDGIALKAMVDAWAAAPASQKEAAFQAAVAVRQIEMGLAATFTLIFGVTVVIFGRALFELDDYPKWIGVLAIFGGAAGSFAGIVMACTGFSSASIAIGVPAGVALPAWMFALGAVMWHSRIKPVSTPW
jgi:hypothetical protein